jgi:hypothetical protein
VSQVRVAELVQQADDLLCGRSSKLCTVDRDLGVSIGQDGVGTFLDLGERQVPRPRNVSPLEGGAWQCVDDDERGVVEAPEELLAGNLTAQRAPVS